MNKVDESNWNLIAKTVEFYTSKNLNFQMQQIAKTRKNKLKLVYMQNALNILSTAFLRMYEDLQHTEKKCQTLKQVIIKLKSSTTDSEPEKTEKSPVSKS